MRITPGVAAVLSKTDLYPDWRRVEELDRNHLDQVSPDIPLFALSADLRLEASRLQDAELNSESGFPDLVAHFGKADGGHEADIS